MPENPERQSPSRIVKVLVVGALTLAACARPQAASPPGQEVALTTTSTPSPGIDDGLVVGPDAKPTRGETKQVAEPPPTLPPEPWAGVEGTYQCKSERLTPCCPQWWPLFLELGWPLEAMPAQDYITDRESGCDPNAIGPLYRGKRAYGLEQLYGWGGLEMLDPSRNISKALELRNAAIARGGSGLEPWCLNHDPVTPPC